MIKASLSSLAGLKPRLSPVFQIKSTISSAKRVRGRQNVAASGGLLKTLAVRRAARLPGEQGPRGHVKAGGVTLICALGRAGVTRMKREGDKATPAGRMALVQGYFRADRGLRPFCRIRLDALPPDLGWCDDAGSPLYNRPHAIPARAGHEAMWRPDGLYDIVFVLDYNLHPRRAGRGSAIFLHCAKPGFKPTLGCVALRPDDLRRLLPRLGRKVTLVVR
jgi:L,D-peptidoglycan transpeptidase YkuD (ErfK/YbiS/YcfS/YnhG family)